MRTQLRASRVVAVLVVAVGMQLLAKSPAPAQTGLPCGSKSVVPAAQDALRVDCVALWTFLTKLDDPGHLDDSGNGQWGLNTAFSAWRGVTVSASGRVVGLNLSAKGLSGPISSELGLLSDLEFLSLDSNNLSGSIPSELGQLGNLESLLLGVNVLSGSIPSEIGRLSNLRYLSLYDNDLSGSIPSELGRLSNLESLHLNSNSLSGSIPSELGQLSNLESLYLNSNSLSGSIPSELGLLSDLEFLSLDSNNLSGSIPSEFGQLVNLTYLNLIDNELTGHMPPGLNQFDPYVNGPMGRTIIGSIKTYSEFTLKDEVWDVWFCDTPTGNAALIPSTVVGRLTNEITPLFSWLSNGSYRPQFQYAGWIEGSTQWECLSNAGYSPFLSDKSTIVGNRPMIISDLETRHGNGGYAGVYATSTLEIGSIAHEVGHALGFPHSFGGLTITTDYRYGPSSRINEYDNPMDLMSGSNKLSGTVAINRYAAGWIDLTNLAIHPKGKTHTYELRPPGYGGTQILVLSDPRLGTIMTLGARVAKGYDSEIPKEGVEVYKVGYFITGMDLFALRIQPFPPGQLGVQEISRTDAYTQHVHSAGDVFKIGTATIEIVERVGDNFTVRVADKAAPSFIGRFSDDDSSAHEANIETIAARDITAGCSPTYPGLFCPIRLVTRAQMMAFMARTLGEKGDTTVYTSRFNDVSDNAWYLPYLERLADLGVVEPYEDGTFRPSEPLTRRDMALFLARAFRHISPVAEPAGVFEDVPAEASYAAEVEAILAAGVTRGCSVDPMLYCPDEPVTRAQMASFLTRALEGTLDQG